MSSAMQIGVRRRNAVPPIAATQRSRATAIASAAGPATEAPGTAAAAGARAAGAQRVRTRLRMTRRGRAVLMSLVTVPVVVILVALALNGGRAIAIGAGKSAPLQSVTVLSGQSLWQLAEHLAPKADPREVIADIVALNTLTSVDVQPGQKLDIPSQYSGR